MNKKHFLSVVTAFFVLLLSCNNSDKNKTSTEKEEVSVKEKKPSEIIALKSEPENR